MRKERFNIFTGNFDIIEEYQLMEDYEEYGILNNVIIPPASAQGQNFFSQEHNHLLYGNIIDTLVTSNVSNPQFALDLKASTNSQIRFSRVAYFEFTFSTSPDQRPAFPQKFGFVCNRGIDAIDSIKIEYDNGSGTGYVTSLDDTSPQDNIIYTTEGSTSHGIYNVDPGLSSVSPVAKLKITITTNASDSARFRHMYLYGSNQKNSQRFLVHRDGGEESYMWGDLYFRKGADATIRAQDAFALNLGANGVNIVSLTPTGALQSLGGRIKKTIRITDADSPYTILSTDEVIFANTDDGAITVNLPIGIDGTQYRLTNCGSNDITVDPGAELLDGVNAPKSMGKGVLDLVYQPTEGWW